MLPIHCGSWKAACPFCNRHLIHEHSGGLHAGRSQRNDPIKDIRHCPCHAGRVTAEVFARTAIRFDMAADAEEVADLVRCRFGGLRCTALELRQKRFVFHAPFSAIWQVGNDTRS